MKTLLILQAASGWMMLGVNWSVQVVHYPLMGKADRIRVFRHTAGGQITRRSSIAN